METQTTLLDIDLKKYKEANVLVLGDIILDKFTYGNVQRLSPEAPIPILNIKSNKTMLGGAGNVLRNLDALGANTYFISVIGDDETGHKVANLVCESTKNPPNLLIDKGRKTPLKTRFIADTQQLLRVDDENILNLSNEIADTLLISIERALSKANVVILSDYGKGTLTPYLCEKIIYEARKKKIPVLVDPKGSDFSKYKNAFLITPNKSELGKATGEKNETTADIEKSCLNLIKKNGFNHVLTTRGAEGMTLCSKDSTQHHPTQARDVFDVSGAGDTVIATVAAGIGAGFTMNESVRLANISAGISVGKMGTAIVTTDEINLSLSRKNQHHQTYKVVSLEQASNIVEKQKIKGKKVGFTNGCFDLLHPGHLSLLSQARAVCDFLIVGLNNDSSIQRLKGDDRPIQSEHDRSLVVSSLADVDLVVLFSEDTPLNLVENLRPDFLVKGADYTEDEVVGGELVKSYGGEIFLASLEKGFSTTNTVTRLKKKISL